MRTPDTVTLYPVCPLGLCNEPLGHKLACVVFIFVLIVELGIVGLLMISKRCVTATPLGSTPGQSAQLPMVRLLMPGDAGVIQNISQSPGVQTFADSVSMASQVTPSAVQGSARVSTFKIVQNGLSKLQN